MEQRTDPSQNFIGRREQSLDAIFLPKSVALIGAKDNVGSVGRTMLLNLTTGQFKGRVYPINPSRQEVLGMKCFPSLKDLPEPVDLAIIVTPAKTVPGLIEECVRSGVSGVIIISAGFKELGAEGLALEKQVMDFARGKLRIIGPNCLGVMNPVIGLNATFAKGLALPGHTAFLSQSGAMCTAVLDWSFKEQIGFSSFVSVGSMADVNWGDLIDYLGGDPNTQNILMYMETIGDPRSFLTAAREIALEKPIIVIKPGRTEAAAKAAASHTGSLAGSDAVFNAALERVGVLRVDTISELFNLASVLSKQPRPKGPSLAIITNAGGPSVLATDAAVSYGAEIAKLEEKTIEGLNKFLPAAWSHTNPVDILGDAGPDQYAKTLDVVSKDPGTDGMLVILSPQDVTDPTETAEILRPYGRVPNKPLLTSWMGGSSVAKGVQILNHAGIPTFEYPDDAAKIFAKMWTYSKNIESLYETPSMREDILDDVRNIANAETARNLISKVRSENRTLLDEYESKQILTLYDIPTVPTERASTAEEAAALAKKMEFPVVLKLLSKTITHKSDVGGVKLNLRSEEDVNGAFLEIQDSVTRLAGKEHFEGVTVQKMIRLEGYEVILGSSIDDQFGPVLLFGTGGQLVEVYKDSSLALPPLNVNLALKLMEKTKIFEAFKGVRGRPPIDVAHLENILVRFSQLVVENPWIKECDINPLLVSDKGIVALDARIVLFEPDTKELPKLAIRPYPSEYIEEVQLKSGRSITLRPIRPEDEALVSDFHRELSEKSVRQRYFEFVTLDERVQHERLVRICFNDYDRELAIVAEMRIPNREIIGIARLSRRPGTQDADLTLLIRDDFHYLGLGTAMVKHLVNIAEKEKIQVIFAKILSENEGMIKICERQGFRLDTDDTFTYASMIV